MPVFSGFRHLASRRAGPGPGVLAVAILLTAGAYGLFGQRPTFQTVSIKQNTSNGTDPTHHPMGLGVDASLRLLIRFAYSAVSPHSLPLPASQVLGGPDWIDSLRYDIDARTADTDPKQIRLMWQTLLADRFKLKLHRETRELPTYDLTVVKNGPQLPAAKAADCVSFPPGTQPRHIPGKVDCGYVSGPFGDSAGLRIRGSKIRMADLVRELTSVLDRPVLDQTGFPGEFDLNLTFRADNALAGFPGLGGSTDPNLPNIFAALDEQLGLRLVPAMGPVEVLVIDHAERPIGN